MRFQLFRLTLDDHNYNHTVPFTVTTANFGSVDSIALVLFAAGKRRLSVPHARFLLHPVTTGLQSAPGQMLQLTEDNLTVLLRGVRTDQAEHREDRRCQLRPDRRARSWPR